MPLLNPRLQEILVEYQTKIQTRQQAESETIKVDMVVARVAAFYEKIRGIVDWREEHLLRKTAIERILKRRMSLQNKKEIAEPLLKELIRGGHFRNAAIPASKIQTIQRIIDKYILLIKYGVQAQEEEKSSAKKELSDWLLRIAA